MSSMADVGELSRAPTPATRTPGPARDAVRPPALLQLLELALARHEPAEVALLRVDVDGFSAVSSRVGQRAADAALSVLTRRLVQAVGPRARLGRLGGDDFAVLVVGATPDHLARLAEHLRRVAAHPIALAGQPGALRLGLGVGTHVAQPGEQPRDVLRGATLSLRAARDRARPAPAPAPPVPSPPGSGSI